MEIKKNKFYPAIFAYFLAATIAGCGPIQANLIEEMDEGERLRVLNEKPTGNLCNAYMHPFIQDKTLADIKRILTQRGVPVCYKDDKEKIVYKKEDLGSTVAAISSKDAPQKLEAKINFADNKSELPSNITASSNNFSVVTVSEWQAALGQDERRWEVEWINKKSTELAENSTKLVNEGNFALGSAKALQSLVLQMHAMSYNDSQRVRESSEKLKDTLMSAGLGQSVLDESQKNLQLVLPISKVKGSREIAGRAAEEKIKYRKASPSEINELKQAVKSSLKDPTSPIFGDFFVVGVDKACVDVNAKNSFGGYVGMHATYLAKVDGAWHSIYDTKSNMMMCINVFARD